MADGERAVRLSGVELTQKQSRTLKRLPWGVKTQLFKMFVKALCELIEKEPEKAGKIIFGTLKITFTECSNPVCDDED